MRAEVTIHRGRQSHSVKCSTVKISLITESFWMSHCDLKSKDTPNVSHSPAAGRAAANTFWQAPQRLVRHAHTQKHTHTERRCPHSSRKKSSFPTTHTCLELRCCNACFLYQTARLVTGCRGFAFGLSGSLGSHTEALVLLLYRNCVYMQRRHRI